MRNMILATGESLIDMLPVGEGCESYQAVPGGSPYNVAMALGRLGMPVGFLGRFSRDHFGNALWERLVASGVELSFSRRVDSLSTIGFVTHNEGSMGPDYAFYTKGTAGCDLSLDDFPNPLAPDIRMLHIGSFSLAVDPIATAVEKLIFDQDHSGRLLAMDINVRPFLVEDRESFIDRMNRFAGEVNLVKLSDEDLNWQYPKWSLEKGCEHYLGLGADLVVVTRGESGVYAANRQGAVEVSAPSVSVIDTVGAGDTFQATLLASLYDLGCFSSERLAGIDLNSVRLILDAASRAAALNCGREGCQPPTRAELDAFDTQK